MTARDQGLARTLHERLATQLIEQLRRGDAPWQREVRPGAVLPYNPHNDKRFHAVNLIALLAQARQDPRWMTYDQAARRGGHVREGERGTRVHCWQYAERRPDGETRPLTHPRLATAVVFNAEQIDGCEPDQTRAPRFARDELDYLLQHTEANIVETQNGVRYEPGTDTLLLPPRATILDDADQAARALRAMAQWTGHPDRLARDVRAPVGSAAAAAEELRAALYVMMCAHEYGLALPRSPRLELREAWISLLERDPLELGRAAADAERIREFLLRRDRHEQQRAGELTTTPTNEPTMDNKDEQHKNKTRQYLAVPYADRHRAGKLGALWDDVARCMYIGPRANHDALAQWLPTGRNMPRSSDAREEFAAVLRSLGLEVTGAHPIMDGRRHRLRAEGDRGRETAGYYIGHLDGVANGFAGNYRTGQSTPWSARGHARSPEERAELRAQAAQAAAARAEERGRLEVTVAAKVQTRIAEHPDLVQLPIQVSLDAVRADREARLAPLSGADQLPYLARKQIAATRGAFVIRNTHGREPDWWPFAAWPCREGTICLPARDAHGKVWTMQYIDPDGGKRFEPNGFKRGCFHVIDARAIDQVSALVLAEGYATATTLHEIVADRRVAVLAGFDSGNLPDVAAALRASYPRLPVVVAGDNDERLLHRPPYKNVGVEKARAAAEVAQGVAITPKFPPGSDPALTDFNDLASLGEAHREVIARQLRSALERAQQQLRARADVRQRTMTRGARV